tara:strand:- start:491 stop:1096 length:606 start_codon:yes stop_codon:yes gene_type:complete
MKDFFKAFLKTFLQWILIIFAGVLFGQLLVWIGPILADSEISFWIFWIFISIIVLFVYPTVFISIFTPLFLINLIFDPFNINGILFLWFLGLFLVGLFVKQIFYNMGFIQKKTNNNGIDKKLSQLLNNSENKKSNKRSRHISQDVKDKVWNRDGGKCAECGSNENLEFDHMIPFSKGGANTYRNLQLLCENCNRKKSNKIG